MGVVERYVAAEFMGQSLERRGDRPRGTVLLRNSQVLEMEAAGDPALAGSFSNQPHQPPDQHGDGYQAQQQRQIDLPEQPAAKDDHHASLSCLLAKT